ncbi:hypothetical protein DUG23_17920 [Salmonella enterica]|nr:hypothetical protein [Salmonella enterica]ECU9999259.1 hypothetical protein [Salmonella enterica subsp. diarizonae serovar 48:i:z]
MKIKAGENNTAKLLTFSSLIPLLVFRERIIRYMCFFLLCFFTGYDKNMRQVFSSSRLFSVLIKIISDIRADFQTDIVFVYPDDLICFYLFVYVAERWGIRR